MKQTICGADFQRMIISAAAAVENRKNAINELNVFPVPDGDTGTNMSMTMNAAATELRKFREPSLSEAVNAAASAMLRGARGNSGVILSLLFRGFSKSWKGKAEADGEALVSALSAGVDAAYRAIMKPTEGTILTVSRVSAESAAEKAASSNGFEDVLQAAVTRAESAVQETLEQNPVLRRAGVVDAGGRGYQTILEGMLLSLQGNDVVCENASDDAEESTDFSVFGTEEITFAYDTVYIMHKLHPEKPLDLLRAYLESIGDSLVISEDDEIFKVHVHTNIPGDALNESAKYGTLETAKIENMRSQHDELVESRQKDAQPVIAAPEKLYGVVAVCAGEGLTEAFRDLGVDQIVEGGQTMNPSTADILAAVNATPAEIVFVLPNNKNIVMAAEQTVPLSEKKVVVIPTKTVPQGITTMLAYDPSLSEGDLTDAMQTAFGAVTTMQITYAARDSEFDGHSIKSGEYLGLYNGALFENSPDITKVLTKMAKQIHEDEKEIISIFYGSDIDEQSAQNTALAIFEKACPDAEVSLLYGGQPVYYYLISAE